LALANYDSVFQRVGILVHVLLGATIEDGIVRPDNSPRIAKLPMALTRERLTANIRFVKLHDVEGVPTPKPVGPPKSCVEAVHLRGYWPGIRSLVGLVETPVLRADGTILTNPGYDSQTSLIYEPAGDTPTILDAPTLDDAKQSLATLLDVVSDFPFDKPEHKAGWIASVLTPIARHAFAGPSPLFLVDANVAGSGKGILIDCTALIITGRRMAVMSQPRDDAEFRKRITALALFGDTIVLIDNVARALGGPSLDAALTATTWKDRLLGRSETVELPLRATWFATGNNVMLQGDMSRRVCHVRLDCKHENPEERRGFKYPNLQIHAREHRAQLLAAALTILRAWFVAEKPDMGLRPWGSFDGWSSVIHNAIVWTGTPDPGATREELLSRADRDSAALRDLIEGWQEIDPEGNGLTASEALKKLEDNPNMYDTLRGAILELCDPHR